LALTAAAAAGLAQEIDTVLLDRDRRSFTILDQIEDPAERRAFQELFRKKDPAEKRKLAEAFLDRHPDSWLLAQVYEIASKASIDLDDLDGAVRYGKLSLRLLPENPLLLVPLANAQVQLGNLAEGSQNALDALEYLDQFARPAAVKPEEWPLVADQLKASAWFAIGRAALTDGLASAGEKRRQLLLHAEAALLRSRGFSLRDAETHYLLGLTCLSLGKRREAAQHFRQAYLLPGPMRERALAQLKTLHEASGKGSFEAYLESVSSQGVAAQASAVANGASQPAGEYAGSDSCRPCHAGQHSSWRETGMARMFRAYKPENVIGDFDTNNTHSDERGYLLARMGKDNGLHFFDLRRSDGTWQRYPVSYTIGSKWQQAYATELPNGEIHVFPIQYSKLRGEWLNFWKIIDPPGSPRTGIPGFHRHTTATAYQVNCTPCHTSQLRLRKPGAWEPANVTFREGGINCEMCHGPAARHVEAMKGGKPYSREAMDPPVDFRKIGSREYVGICAQCHMQSAMRDPEPAGALNFSTEASFVRRYVRRPYTEFSKKAFFKDGRFRETSFIVESFVRSACYRRGQAHCGHCHNPHPEDAPANPKSLKFRDEPDRMCLQCHPAYAQNIEAHTRHPASSEASRCVSCHMPRIMHALLFDAGYHQIDDTPDAEMTARFGQSESPNACLLCHRDKDAEWLTEYGDRLR
jgi:tetratricopeptide (TPR) repeat protein